MQKITIYPHCIHHLASTFINTWPILFHSYPHRFTFSYIVLKQTSKLNPFRDEHYSTRTGEQLQNRKKLRETNCAGYSVCLPLPLPQIRHSVVLTPGSVPTGDCISKLTSLTCEWCFSLISSQFQTKGNTSRRSESGSRCQGIYSS